MKKKIHILITMTGLSLYALLGWIVGLVILLAGVVLLARDALALRRALRPITTCPRGHVNPQYGTYRCTACGMVWDGWAWRCPCGAWSGHIRCLDCGHSIRSPLVH